MKNVNYYQLSTENPVCYACMYMKAWRSVIHIVVLWVMMSCSLVDGYQHSQLHSDEKSINLCKLILERTSFWKLVRGEIIILTQRWNMYRIWNLKLVIVYSYGIIQLKNCLYSSRKISSDGKCLYEIHLSCCRLLTFGPSTSSLPFFTHF
jgi:hypothetical protein